MSKAQRATIGWRYDYRYTLAHVSRYVQIEENDLEAAWCRVIPLCHGVQSRNATVLRSDTTTLAKLLASPLRHSWSPCPRCLQYARELAAEEAGR